MPRNNILVRTLAAPKRMQLPNSRVFYAKYQRVAGNALPERVKVKRTYIRKIGLQRQQRQKNQAGRGMTIQDLISKAIELEKKVAKSNLGKMTIQDTIDYV